MVGAQAPLCRSRKYIFVFQGDVHGGENAYNTKLVDPQEFKSYRDFLAPKWKGKTVA